MYSTMTSSSILVGLKSGAISKIDKEVEKYLSPVLSKKVDDIDQYGTFAIQFLHGSFSVISAGGLSEGLLVAVETCYRCYRLAKNQIKLTEPLAVPKLLYHIVTKLPLTGYHQHILTLLTCLHEELEPLSHDKNDMVTTIISNTFSRMWNLTVKHEQEAPEGDLDVLKLRHAILKIMLLKSGAVTAVINKFVLAMTRYEKISIQKSHELDSTCVVDIATDVIHSLLLMTLSGEEELSLLTLLQFLLRYGSQYDLDSAIENCLLSVKSLFAAPRQNQGYESLFKIYLICGRQVYTLNKNSCKKTAGSIKNGRSISPVLNIEMNENLNEIIESVTPDKLNIAVEILIILVRYIDRKDMGKEEIVLLFQTLCKVDEILLKWISTEEKQAKAVIDFVQSQIKIIFKCVKSSDGDDFSSWIQICQSVSGVYNSVLSSEAAKDQDRHYCGYVMSKLGQMCSEKTLFQQATVFYKVACSQLKLYVDSDNSLQQKRTEEVCLGRKYICLAETYLKTDDTTPAMETLAVCVLSDSSHMTHAIRTWVRLKKDLIKNGKDDFIQKTLGQAVLAKDNRYDICGLLKAENDAFKSTRKRIFPAEIEILKQLTTATEDPLVKGKCMLEMAIVFWQSGLKDNQEILKHLNNSESVLNKTSGSEEVLGQVLLWQFVISQEETSQQILSSINLTVETTKTEPGEEPETVVTDSPSVYMTVTKQQEAMTVLEKAVALWDSINNDISDVPLFLQSLMICARLYELFRMEDKQLHVIQMYHRVMEKYSVTATSDALSLMIETLLSLNFTSQASNLIQDTDDWDRVTWNEQMVYFQIARSHVNMYCHQYEKAISILRDVLTLISSQDKTWTVLLLEGKAKRLMSQLLTFPELSVTDYSLDYAYEAVRFHTGVIQFLLGKGFLSTDTDGSKGNTVDRWTAITEVLKSLYTLGTLFSHVGEAREAKCYLKEGWKIARYFGLPSWNIKFSSEVARLHCISDKVDDAVKAMTEIRGVLPSTDKTLSEIPDCINHIIEEEYCDYCQNNTKLVLDLVPVVSQVFIAQGKEEEACNLLEKSESIVCKLQGNESTKTKNKSSGKKRSLLEIKSDLTSLYFEILTYLLELSLSKDPQKCQELILKGNEINNSDLPFHVVSRFRLYQSLSSVNWQSLTFVSSMSDSSELTSKTKEHKSVEEDIFDALPVANLSKKFEKMTVDNKSNEENKTTQKKKTGSKAGKQSLESDNGEPYKENTEKKEELVTQATKVRGKHVERLNSFDELGITQTNVKKEENVSKNADFEKLQTCKENLNSVKTKINSKASKLIKPVSNDCDTPMLQTPCKSQHVLLMKTPRSVCSRKAALDKLLDSDNEDEDDIQPLTSTRKTKMTTRKGNVRKSVKKNSDVYQFSDEEKDESEKKQKFKTPIPVTKKKLFDSEKPDRSSKISKPKSTRGRKVKDCDNQSLDVEVARETSVEDNSSPKSSDTKLIKCNSKIPRLSKNNMKQSCKTNETCTNEKNKDQNTDVYDFVENEVEQSSKKNVKGKKNVMTRTRRMPRSKVEGTEKARSDSDSDDDKLFDLDGSFSIKDDESEITEGNLTCEDYSLIEPVHMESEEYENIVIHEVTEYDFSLNESIEMLRGDNKPGRRGRTQKKTTDDQQPGETPAEVLRSSKLVKRPQIKTEKIVKVEAAPKKEPNSCDTNNQLIQTLETAYHQMKHLPSPPVYSSICHMLALQYLESSPLKAAFYLAESIAITFRHQSLVNAARKIRKCNKSNDNTDATDLQKSQEILQFNKTEEEFRDMMSQIPEGWSCCQMSVVSQSTPPMLMLSRLDKGGQPIVVQLPGFNSSQGQKLLDEFTNIINESRDSMKITDKNEWWRWRRSLDSRMQVLLETMEKCWLGRWKFLLLGNPVGVDDTELQRTTDTLIKKMSPNKPVYRPMVKALLQNGYGLTEGQVQQILSDISGDGDMSGLVETVTEFWSKHISYDVKRSHVILLLDKALQHLPWENLPILKKHSLSRLPSLYHMINYLSQQQRVEATHDMGVSMVDQQNVYYVLNPDNNLPATKETFQDWFEKTKGWKGITGKPPTAEQYKTALTQYDLLVYCGHGSGSKYLNGDDLQQLRCRAAVFLMGCSSGQLTTKGQLEASGMMLNYFLANCPCIVSNLWDVTDKDIDRFLEHLLQSCLSEKSCDVLSEIPSAREACRLPYLIGAAPVVYGFPIITKSTSKK